MRRTSTAALGLLVSLSAAAHAQVTNPVTQFLRVTINSDREVILTNLGKQVITGWVLRFYPGVMSPALANYQGAEIIDGSPFVPGKTETTLTLTEPRIASAEAVAVILDDGRVILSKPDAAIVEQVIASMFKNRALEAVLAQRFRNALGNGDLHAAIAAAGSTFEDPSMRSHFTTVMNNLLDTAANPTEGALQARQWLDTQILRLTAKRKDVVQ